MAEAATQKPNNVRIAMVGDEDAIFKILCTAHEDNGMMKMDESRVKEAIRTATEKRGGVIGIIEGEREIEGILFLTLSRFWYSVDWHIEDCCNFVHPDYRKSNHASDLIQFGKWFAEQLDTPLFIGILTVKRLSAKVKLYGRKFNSIGAVFSHNLKTDGVIDG